MRSGRSGTGLKEEKKDIPEGKNANVIVKSRTDVHVSTTELE